MINPNTHAADFTEPQLRVIRLIGMPGELEANWARENTAWQTRRFLESVGIIKLQKPYRPGRNDYKCSYVLTQFGKRIYAEVQGANRNQ